MCILEEVVKSQIADEGHDFCFIHSHNGVKQIQKAAGVNHSDLRHVMAAHTGQSSQLFDYATRRKCSVSHPSLLLGRA